MFNRIFSLFLKTLIQEGAFPNWLRVAIGVVLLLALIGLLA